MLDRVLVKRIRDSDSDSEKEEESSSSQSNKSSTDKPTDILTTDKPIETQVCTTHNKGKTKLNDLQPIQILVAIVKALH